VEWSLELVESLHARWVMPVAVARRPAVETRVVIEQENGPMTVELLALTYAWHSRHHISHITHLRARENW